MRTVLLLCLASLALPAAASELYKWTDEKGRVHYSDKPPPEGVKAESRDLPQEANSDPSASPKPVPPPSAQCLQARQSLATLEQNTNVAADLDGDGTPEPLDETARQAQIVAARKAAQQLCAPPKPARSPETGSPPARPAAEGTPPQG